MRKQALVLAGLIIVGSATDVPASSPCSNGIVIPEPEKHPALVEDCEALLAVRDQLDLQIWPAEGSWTVDNPITEWFGVTVEEYRVRKLELHSAYEFHEVTMQGHLPSELGELTALTDLALTHDGIEGEIPPEVANLTNLLSLVLYGSMTGRIPAEIGELTQLMELYLGGHLTGTIPPELGKLTQLVGLGISGTNLTGQIPPALFNLRQLKRLYLNDNSLTGPIPPELFTNLRSLTELNLGNWSQGQNRWTGPIPPEIGRLHELSSLRIQNAGLTGAIPPEIGDLSRLVYLYLDHNELSGSIPPEVGRLRGLSNLYLNDNQLSGPIPPELGNFGGLTNLHLNDNQLTGSIPPELGQLGKLWKLDLSNNSLTGRIPPELGKLSYLAWLILLDNDIIGPLPRELGQLGNLHGLLLDPEVLVGCIPAGLSRLLDGPTCPEIDSPCENGIEDIDGLPLATDLAFNYPNPFNACTRITYLLADGGPVRIAIYSVLGQRIHTLVDEVQSPGFYQVSWDGRDSRGQPSASGNYLCRLTTSEEIITRKLTLLR